MKVYIVLFCFICWMIQRMLKWSKALKVLGMVKIKAHHVVKQVFAVKDQWETRESIIILYIDLWKRWMGIHICATSFIRFSGNF